MSIPSAQVDELAFLQSQVNKLASVPVQYEDDFISPEGGKPRKPQLVEIPVTPLPETKTVQSGGENSSAGASDTISLTIKSLKPPLTFTLPAVSLSDSIASLKELLASSNPTAPPPSNQRLLLKGKALADTKLLKEYIATPADGVTLTLMVKAGGSSTPTAPTSIDMPPPIATPSTPPQQIVSASPSSSSRPLTPIPTLTLTPSPDLDFHPTSTSPSHSPHATLSDPQFWLDLLEFFRSKYAKAEEAEQAWETFLRSQKGGMSPGEVAKARDVTEIHAMGGSA